MDKIFEKPATETEKPYKIKQLLEEGKISVEKTFLGFRGYSRFLLYFAYLSFVLFAFIALSPLSYGLPVSPRLNSIYTAFIALLNI